MTRNILVVCALLLPFTLFAQSTGQPVASHGPMFTINTNIPAAGVVETEHRVAVVDDGQAVFYSLLRLGVGKRTEVYAGYNDFQRSIINDRGITKVGDRFLLGLRTRVAQIGGEKNKLSFGLLPEAEIFIRNGDGGRVGITTLTTYQNVPHGIIVNFNQKFLPGSGKFVSEITSSADVYKVFKKHRVGVGFRRQGLGGKVSDDVEIGYFYAPNRRVSLGPTFKVLAVNHANQELEKFRVGMGVSIQLGHLWDKK